MTRFILLLSFFASCQTRSVTRVQPDTTYDLSGRWNDAASRMMADQMIADLMQSTNFKDYANNKAGKPAIVVGVIKNKTTEHIDASNYIKKIELAIFNSGTADIVESEEFRDKMRVERLQQQDFADPETVAEFGKEIGADLMLFGEMTSETDVFRSQKVVNYMTSLYLTDIETNKRIWFGQHEIKKVVRN
jgi:uncharacterized protein (TIGR02722 family)